MKRHPRSSYSLVVLAALLVAPAGGLAEDPPFRPLDVFELEWAQDPQVSPDGSRVVYARSFMDLAKDRRRSNLWIVGTDGKGHRPLTTGLESDGSPRWSPSGDRIAYVSRRGGTAQLWVRWMESGQTAEITRLRESPAGLAWSPDGRWLAFTMFVPETGAPWAATVSKPEGAEWAPAPKAIEQVYYRADGAGYLRDGYSHLFVVPAEGGTPRQLTTGPYDHEGPSVWMPDGETILLSANRHEDRLRDPLNSEIYAVSTTDGSIRQLTDREGPDGEPAVSPDGARIAYTGFDDRYQGYQVRRLYVMEADGSASRMLTSSLDRSVEDPAWSPDGKGVYVQYDDQATTRIAFVTLDGEVRPMVEGVGGTSLGRPYSGGSFSVGGTGGGRVAFTAGSADRPADVAMAGRDASPRRLTALNEDLLAHRDLGEVEEIWFESSADGRRIQGWIVRPPGFDPERKYPLILEIHGGPFANYGPRYAAEIQLYAAAGYVVLYTNPRGSAGYGEEFGNLIHHAYPGDDYHDLMSGVDALIERGWVDPERLYVTGGSGGGVLSAWIVGTTNRFRAAAVQKPVINWYSFVLTADAYPFFTRYWFPGPPWEEPEHYMARSPISRVGNVETPTLVITGEQDFRTPISESEQYYQALKLREVDTALVRIPEASHGIAARPSHLIAKVGHVLGWFARYGGPDPGWGGEGDEGEEESAAEVAEAPEASSAGSGTG